ncbi:hypothetical protein GGI25_004800 [Coemansia spiralis]|uniref:Uncharacterized protein n=2 Tax=Coemansia TaxID=4863 RepID=A0A9W8G434_9FUNG|nr:hypothetical protein BX070DRAFT_9755 [Coemansia spiralis]KAJ1989258.1 hypothetical protein EDC05_004779 [Coemansia umbellata]KAJ2620254.1 hypothetical protein GGI26_005143 [Coemansia sp. RSA 1358]KAJ2673206.1 hypothetical protein GGI25_004800 [Coemansia spiralis]
MLGSTTSLLPATAAAIAVLAASVSAVSEVNLLTAAATATDTKAFESSVSSNWVSIFYQVNQNINSQMYMGGSSAYSVATWLYGTDQLPASYDPKWASGYLNRAHELYSQTATDISEDSSSSQTKKESSQAEESSSDKEEPSSDKEEPSSDKEEPSSSKTSAAMPRGHIVSTASVALLSAVMAVASAAIFF